MAHLQYILWAVGGPAGFAAACRYVPRAFLMLMGGLTTNKQRSKQCATMIVLSRKDAKELLDRLGDSSEKDKPTAAPPGERTPDMTAAPVRSD
jgi:hypothetical protein